MICPCGSELAMDACCGPIVAGAKRAPTAEALMRSRYTAFALGDVDHLRRSWHPDTCPADIRLLKGQVWVGLDVVATTAGGRFDKEGTVSFVARYERAGKPAVLRETSRFSRVGGAWVYVAADATAL